MPSLTNTVTQRSFTLDRSPGEVTFHFTTDGEGPHWHERYTELFRVVKGRVRVVIDGKESTLTPDDGHIRVPKFAVHQFMRADADQSDKDPGEVVVEEWCDPADGFKEVFFRNLLGVIQDSTAVFGWKTPLQILMISSYCDDYPVIVGGPLKYYLSHALYGLAWVLGRSIGLEPWYEEYTPDRIRSIAAAGGTGGKPKTT